MCLKLDPVFFQLIPAHTHMVTLGKNYCTRFRLRNLLGSSNFSADLEKGKVSIRWRNFEIFLEIEEKVLNLELFVGRCDAQTKNCFDFFEKNPLNP